MAGEKKKSVEALKAATKLKRKYLKEEFKKKGPKKAMPYGKWILKKFKEKIGQPNLGDDTARELRKMR